MKIRTLVRKGVDHRTFCEDFLYTFENENLIIAATFDGCSDGVDAHFASSLSGKCLSWVVQSVSKNDFYHLGLESVFNEILFKFLYKLDCMKITLNLTNKEVLSTVILLVYDKKEDKGKIIAMGDGIIKINGNLIILDQNNEPEYPIKYASKVTESQKTFIEFLNTHTNKWDFEKLEDVTISTDGMEQLTNKFDVNLKFMQALDFFITDEVMSDLPVMLGRKYNILKMKGWENRDDLGVIRIMKEESIKNESKIQEPDTAVHS